MSFHDAIILTAHKHAGERGWRGKERKKKKTLKKTLASRPKNVSNELADHIPTRKSQNHIQTYNNAEKKKKKKVDGCGTPDQKRGPSPRRPNEHPPTASHDAIPEMARKSFWAAKIFP